MANDLIHPCGPREALRNLSASVGFWFGQNRFFFFSENCAFGVDSVYFSFGESTRLNYRCRNRAKLRLYRIDYVRCAVESLSWGMSLSGLLV